MKFPARKLFYALPPAWRFAARRLYFLPADAWDSLTGNRDGLTPPRGLIFTGGGDFKKAGQALLQYFKEYGGLQADGQVLDVGSGIGRGAIPLTGFLNENGRYEGFDVVEQGVAWCRENISARFPNFHFQYIPLDNDLYRAAGGGDASRFTFPFADGQFSLAIVNSVFTHLLPEEVENYLGEIFRVLRPGGVCYATFFLFDKSGQAKFPEGFEFPYGYGHYRLMDDEVKSANVAFEESYLRSVFEKHRLEVRHLFYGSWRDGRVIDCKDFQDIVILEKKI